MVRALSVVAVAVCLCAAAGARGDEPEPESQPASQPAPLEGDPTFGPLVTVERIQITGNERTKPELIRRALLVKEGETLRMGDPRFRRSRFRVLALGYFADVQLLLDRGSEPGAVVLLINVVERGTLILNRIYLGTSDETTAWAGIDVGDASLFGTGVGLSLGFVWADAPKIQDGATQAAFRLEVSGNDVKGLPIGLHASILYADASDPYRIAGDPADGDPANFAALRYQRYGGMLGGTWDLTRLSSLHADLRFELVDGPASLPAGLRLEPGTSRVSTLSLGFERDTRPDPILPSRGTRLVAVAEVGSQIFGGSYDYLRAQARYGIWIPIGSEGHVLSLSAGAGVIVGDSPRFDRFYIGDVNPLVAMRPLDLVVSTRPQPDFLGTGADKVSFGDLYAGGAVEWSYQLFRKKKTIYCGDLFVSVGAFGLGQFDDKNLAGAFPIDITFNAGVRLDTQIGVFELSLGNLLGRLPL